MSSNSEGSALWEGFRTLVIAILKLFGLLVAWSLKIIGTTILYISSLIFRYTAK
jgi:hypothetical protein